ncbi:MAG TPA: DUF1360 domain-containing protein [Solirubrobacteraceae bacterium]|nr:DUF1360 domain-containing protein [Solirubrobacteraceae bacterium]
MDHYTLEDRAVSRDGPPQQDRPLRGYALLMSVFATLATAFSLWLHRSGRRLPERVDAGDLAVLTVATHKASRLLTKDKVTSTVRAPFTRFQGNEGAGEVSEAARGTGVRRAVGELLVCPYCVGMWIAAGFAAGLVVAPRATRLAASILTILFGSDMLQIAYRKAEETL